MDYSRRIPSSDPPRRGRSRYFGSRLRYRASGCTASSLFRPNSTQPAAPAPKREGDNYLASTVKADASASPSPAAPTNTLHEHAAASLIFPPTPPDLSNAEIFRIWIIVLLASGISINSIKGKVRRGTALTVLFTIYAFVVVLRAAWNARS